MSALSEKIRSRGYWEVVIRPARFVERRVPRVSMLFPLIERCSVRLRGWDYPHVDTRREPERGEDWVGQEFEWNHYLSAWRFYRSGQFAHLFGMFEDWRDQSQLWPAPMSWRPGRELGIGNALDLCREIVEFASRLALTEAGDDQMVLAVTVGGLRDRALWSDDPSRTRFVWDYKAAVHSVPWTREVTRAELVANVGDISQELASELFDHFGWTPSHEQLRALQRDR